MTPQEFRGIWTKNGDILSPFSLQRLKDLKLLPSTSEFLVSAGLPPDAAPFLSFAQDKDDIYFGINKLTDQYDFLDSEYEKYVVIGSCSDGDPIAINTGDNDQIEWLDHEDLFSSRFFNSSIMTLAGCLVAYRDFVLTVQMENGEDAVVNSDFSDNQFEKLQQALIAADDRAVKEGFWKEQLEIELALRQDARDNK
ncbi:MAG TPA: SUKH-4 family immunity protein [Flavisolibacter sp.]|nr:SUKH-4 family immunity protein [Flavisolibacter sp.]